ncbi:MAG: hypothetical protein LAO19_02605 [Acidobacteriia bacterium]|nr:hypothetical protein [Terriglobia bacterium]
MKAFFLAMLPSLIASSLFAQLPFTEEQMIEYSKSIDVKMLDPSLPSERLEDWLRSGPPHSEFLRWESDDTCDNKPDPDTDYPRCVHVAFGRGGQSGYFLVHIGTLRKGIIGPPQLYQGIGVQESIFVQTGWTERLSGLSNLLDQPVVTTRVTELYDAIVARHPIGIPRGSDKAMIWSFLSLRLRQQLETAQVCQDDYRRHHAKTKIDQKPGWLRTGIFVGDSKRALPLNALVTNKEPRRDGSFEVHVTLTYVKLPGFVPDNAQWVIIATVVPEGDRFVVDDVRLFDGLDTDGPSHLLSETFPGCDGPKWTGERINTRAHVALPGAHFTDWNAVNALRGRASEEEITLAKVLDVHQLDPLLSSQRLENWLRADPLNADHVYWSALGCNITEGQYGATPNPDGGLCAAVWFQRGNAFVEIKVSNGRKGMPGTPRLDYMKVDDKDERLLSYLMSDLDKVSDSDRLSDLPRLLDHEGAIEVARNLYDIIVEHHPLGIPQADDRSRILPLLSTRLRKQLQDAQACQDDYLHQSPTSDRNQKPMWFNVGLFSGEGELTAPGAELIDHEEQKDDGSVHVIVWLSRKGFVVPKSATSASSWRNWHVSVAVRAEDGRFAVDDVRIFDGLSADSPSHLLTDSFAGCNGARWVGVDSRVM